MFLLKYNFDNHFSNQHGFYKVSSTIFLFHPVLSENVWFGRHLATLRDGSEKKIKVIIAKMVWPPEAKCGAQCLAVKELSVKNTNNVSNVNVINMQFYNLTCTFCLKGQIKILQSKPLLQHREVPNIHNIGIVLM